MKSLPYWIQRADFATTDHDPVDVATALRVFDAHPWPDELAFESELEAGGHDYCPPGIGFVDPDGPILHLCPSADGHALVHYHVGSSVRSRAGVLRGEAVELIHQFFHGQHDWILRKLDVT